jgi:hypothetical protein
MKRFLAVVVFVALALGAVPALADVTIKMTVSTSGPMPMEITSATYIKGLKMRADTQVVGQDISVLIDVAAKLQLMLNHGTKEIQDPQAMTANLPMSFGEAKVSITPSGETKELLGRTCVGFTIVASVPMTVGDETVMMNMSGPVWIWKEGAGVAEYQAFYKASAAAGLSISPSGQGAQNKSMAEMQRVVAENGIPLEQNTQITVDGTGPIAQMMSQAGNISMTSTVSEITTTAIPDDKFVVPAGYTKK